MAFFRILLAVFLTALAYVSCLDWPLEASLAPHSKLPINSADNPAFRDALSSSPVIDGVWVAGRNARFDHSSLEDARGLLGLKAFSWTTPPSVVEKQRAEAPRHPTHFDARQQWPGCVHPVLNQGDCGSCWAFGSSESLSDRFCIRSNSTINVALSPQYLVSCTPFYDPNFGCDGGLTQTAWDFMANDGIPTLDCYPYTSGGNGTVPKCHRDACTSSSPSTFKLYHVQLDSVHTYVGEEDIQSALLKGPVEAAFAVFEDFMYYKSGVYVRTSDAFMGLHAIKMIGWGVDETSGKKYWICQNSWGTDWGMQGFFNILRGDNECFIESDVVAGEPLLNSR